MDKPKVKTYVHSRTVPVSYIKIPKAYRLTTPSEAKVEQCLSFYIDNGYFDRDIIINQHGYIMDGYIAYLVAKAQGLEKVKVIQIVPKLQKPDPVPVTIKLNWRERLSGKLTVTI